MTPLVDVIQPDYSEGLVKPLNILLNLLKYVCILEMLRNTWDIPNDLMGGLESVTSALYGIASNVSKVDDRLLMSIEDFC